MPAASAAFASGISITGLGIHSGVGRASSLALASAIFSSSSRAGQAAGAGTDDRPPVVRRPVRSREPKSQRACQRKQYDNGQNQQEHYERHAVAR